MIFSIFHPWRSCLYLLANILNIELESGDSYQVESKFIVDLIYARKFKKIWNFDKKIWNFDKKQVEKNGLCSNFANKSWKKSSYTVTKLDEIVEFCDETKNYDGFYFIWHQSHDSCSIHLRNWKNMKTAFSEMMNKKLILPKTCILFNILPTSNYQIWKSEVWHDKTAAYYQQTLKILRHLDYTLFFD